MNAKFRIRSAAGLIVALVLLALPEGLQAVDTDDGPITTEDPGSGGFGTCVTSHLTVTKTDDAVDAAGCEENDCSLREAVMAANASVNPCGVVIHVPEGTYFLTLPEPDKWSSADNDQRGGNLNLLPTVPVSVVGDGEGITIVDGSRRFEIFDIGGWVNNTHRVYSRVSLSKMTLQNGGTVGAVGGCRAVSITGGFDLTDTAVVRLDHLWIFDNCFSQGAQTDVWGSAVQNVLSIVTISDSYMDNNGANSSVFNSGLMTIAKSLIRGSYAGHGLFNRGGHFTLDQTTIESNSGAGIWDFSGHFGHGDPLTIKTSNIMANEGGGIVTYSAGTISNTVINHNTNPTNAGGLVSYANLKLDDVEIRHNAGVYGGGLANWGTMTIAKSQINENSSFLDPNLPGQRGAFVRTDGAGGGIANGGSLTVTDSEVNLNEAKLSGGGIANGYETSNGANLTLVRVTVDGNVLNGNVTDTTGGGIANFESLTVSDSTISNNNVTAPSGAGGGVANEGGFNTKARVTGSTISGNTAAVGGGIENWGGTATLVNATISGNRSDLYGGGIANLSNRAAFFHFAGPGTPTTLHLFNVTVTDNEAAQGPGGVANRDILNIKDTIIAGNRDLSGSETDCGVDAVFLQNAPGDAKFQSQGYNLVGEVSGAACQLMGAGDQFGVRGNPINAGLKPLANNGGPTRTHDLDLNSPAVDSGDPNSCTDDLGNGLATDQRGLGRPFAIRANVCDRGSVEAQ